MVQYVLKRCTTGSTVTVEASEIVNTLHSKIESMMEAVFTLRARGEDQTPIKMHDDVTMLPQEALDECKEMLMEIIKDDVSMKLHEAGDSWSFEDLIVPIPED